MNKKHRKTLSKIFENPIRSDIKWRDIENLLVAEGAIITEGSGSRIRVEINKKRAVFHRPHPRKVTDKGAVKSVRIFLELVGITP